MSCPTDQSNSAETVEAAVRLGLGSQVLEGILKGDWWVWDGATTAPWMNGLHLKYNLTIVYRVSGL